MSSPDAQALMDSGWTAGDITQVLDAMPGLTASELNALSEQGWTQDQLLSLYPEQRQAVASATAAGHAPKPSAAGLAPSAGGGSSGGGGSKQQQQPPITINLPGQTAGISNSTLLLIGLGLAAATVLK